jgi:hypothetical protein
MAAGRVRYRLSNNVYLLAEAGNAYYAYPGNQELTTEKYSP